MTDAILNALIKAAYTDRKALHELQAVTREQTQQIIAELTRRDITEYVTPEHKASLRQKSVSRFDTKAAAAEDAAFVERHTVRRTYDSVQIL